MTITGSGISLIDGNYWVTMDGDNLVLVDKSNSHSLYCTNSSTPPCSDFKSVDDMMSFDNPLTETRIYPNPSSGEISIEMGNIESITSIKLYDLAGKILYSNANITENIVHVNGLKKGVYTVNIESNGNNYYEKLIVY
jgi:hypothetical protein